MMVWFSISSSDGKAEDSKEKPYRVWGGGRMWSSHDAIRAEEKAQLRSAVVGSRYVVKVAEKGEDLAQGLHLRLGRA